VAHSFELPFVFGHFDLGRLGDALFDKATLDDRNQLSDAMMRYWSHFATKGSPNDSQAWDLPKWNAWDDATPDKRFIVLDSPSEGGIHMSADTQTVDRIITDIDKDPRLPQQIDKCRIFHELAGWTHGISRADYEHAGKAGCAAFPYGEYPWSIVR